jgi:polyphosphate kinase 2
MKNIDALLTSENIKKLNSNKGLLALLRKEPLNYFKALKFVEYEIYLKELQVELIKLQTWLVENDEKIVVILEGRDAAGKGGAIRRITEKMNPRHLRIVALPIPTEVEKTQWYFQRYVRQLPKAGEIVFFDRSWYNRAVVEPVNNFCTQEEYNIFMSQVNEFEKMIIQSGTRIVKFYISISKREQAMRFNDIKTNPLKQWKMTQVDENAQELWNEYTKFKNKMFLNIKENNGLKFKVIKANSKKAARVGVIKHLLKSIPYQNED